MLLKHYSANGPENIIMKWKVVGMLKVGLSLISGVQGVVTVVETLECKSMKKLIKLVVALWRNNPIIAQFIKDFVFYIVLLGVFLIFWILWDYQK
jgi:ABC-type amino acid transport system permease subunit